MKKKLAMAFPEEYSVFSIELGKNDSSQFFSQGQTIKTSHVFCPVAVLPNMGEHPPHKS